jgi:hypothetical protein
MEEGGPASPGGEPDTNGSIHADGSSARGPTWGVVIATKRRSSGPRSTVTAGEEGFELASFGAQPSQQGIAAPIFCAESDRGQQEEQSAAMGTARNARARATTTASLRTTPLSPGKGERGDANESVRVRNISAGAAFECLP